MLIGRWVCQADTPSRQYVKRDRYDTSGIPAPGSGPSSKMRRLHQESTREISDAASRESSWFDASSSQCEILGNDRTA